MKQLQKIKIGTRVNPIVYSAVKQIAHAKCWSISKLSEVAIELYIDLELYNQPIALEDFDKDDSAVVVKPFVGSDQ